MGYEVSHYLKILTKISKEKEKQIDDFIINYFDKTVRKNLNPIYGKHAGYQIKWYECETDMQKISNEFPEVKFILYCCGEDNQKWYYIFENGQTVKREEIKRYVKFINSKGEKVVCEEDNDIILEELE